MKFKVGQHVFCKSKDYGLVSGIVLKEDAGISRDAVLVDVAGKEIALLTDSCHIHIQNEATKMVADWKKNGFNGVYFDECYVEKVNTLEDFLSDGQTKEEYEEFISGYVIFVARPEEPLDLNYTNDYTRVSFGRERLVKDLIVEMRRLLGEDIKVEYHRGCHEFEISQ